MTRAPSPVRFIVLLVLGLALLTLLGWVVVTRTTRDWYIRDLELRARLAVQGTHRSLGPAVRERRVEHATEILTDVAHDRRILAAAACAPDGTTVATTPEYPGALGCSRIRWHVAPAEADPSWRRWSAQRSLAGGDVQVSALPIRHRGVAGFAVIVQDLSHVTRRETATGLFLAVAFAVLAAAASILTLIAQRFAWRGWSAALQRQLRGEEHHPQFAPIVRDVRELVDQIANDRDPDAGGARWGPERLRAVLQRNLGGERVVCLANREPYIHEHTAEGAIRVVHPASGLVTAMEPVMRACSGVWVAHAAGSADAETADARGRLRVPPAEESYWLRRVWLSPEEEQGYYYGFANEGLWPLCHVAHTRPVFRGDDWIAYREVNRRFADAVCEEVDGDDPIILVQDYHFALAPRFLRERLPRATILTFWHIPWPNAERFGICPMREALLDGLLGSSIVGFHTPAHCQNFLDTVDRYLEARIDRAESAVTQQGRATLVRPYPISLEWPSRWMGDAPPVEECRATVRAELGLSADVRLGVGVDRLDYTKGVEERLLAVERMMERFPEHRGRFTFVQLAAPSRTKIDRYRELNDRVDVLAERINARFATEGWRPIALLRAHHEPPTVYRFYRAAELCYVSSLHDGMNLVAKEYIAARDDEQGVLVLSQFTGAARELTEALIVNPYDVDEAAAAMHAALCLPPSEQRDRMRAMRRYLAEFNVHRWAGRMVVDAATLRRRERLQGRRSDISGRITRTA